MSAGDETQQNKTTLPNPTIQQEQPSVGQPQSSSVLPETDNSLAHEHLPQSPYPCDISQYASYPSRVSELTDDVKYSIILERKPDSSYKYPAKEFNDTRRKSGVSLRSCQPAWIDKYDFLGYSKCKDGLYCIACILFPTQTGQSGNAHAMVETPYSNWKNCIATVEKHSDLTYHKRSEAKMLAFIMTRKSQKSRIDFSMSSAEKERIAKNRTFLTSVLKCIEFCGRQGIALRGHRDDACLDSTNQGNFKALIDFRVEAGDGDLEHHLETCKKNATYISKTSQNELLLCMKEYLQGEIIKEIKRQKHGINYAVLADEVSDVSNWEQLGLVLRYVKDNTPTEKLVEFIPCESITGEAIHHKLKECLHQLSLNPADCRAQGYDGAGNMAGKLKGCAARFRQEVPRAIYYHCASHQLNLALSAACRIPEIQCAISHVKELGLFFKYSPKRQRELERSVEAINDERKALGEAMISKKKVKMLCDTRWVERHIALEEFEEMYPAILMCLERIITPVGNDSGITWDSKSVIDGNGLYKSITSPSFIAAFQTVRYLFGFTKDLSVLLQGTANDVLTAYNEINMVCEELKSIRRKEESGFLPVFQAMIKMATLCGLDELTIPRRCGRQTQRNNVAGDSPEVYWRRCMFVPFLDYLIAELSRRFDQVASIAVLGLSLIPSHLPDLTDEQANQLDASYSEDLPSPSTFHQELKLWRRKWDPVEKGPAEPTNLQETLCATNHHLFPNISRILYLLLLSPVTTAQVERSNSSLKFIKTPLRSTMGADRFNALVLLFVHKDLPLDYSAVIDRFASRNHRRMLLVNPMSESE